MTKLITIGTALALALTLSAAGCKKKTDEAAKTNTETKKPEETKGSAATPTPGSAAVPAAGSAAPVDPAAGSAAVPGGTAAPADPAAAASTGVAECDEYFATVEKAAKCDKFGPAADGIKKSAEAMKMGFAAWGALDETARKAAQSAAATTCKGASDGVKTTATGLGCTL